MEHKMLWGALAVGGVGWLCLLLLAALGGARSTNTPTTVPVRQSGATAFHWLSLALPVAVWLATLPAKAPFSSGQGFGRGFLLGGLVAALSCFAVLREGKVPNRGRHFALTSLFGALLVACVPVIWMRYAIIEGLLGASLGWCAVSLLWACAPHREGGALARGAASGASLGLLNGSAFATALCSLTALGVYRDFSLTTGPRAFSPIALVVAASIGLALLFGVLLNDVARDKPISSQEGFLRVVAALACLTVPFGIGFLLATRLLDDLRLVYCLGTGAVLAVLGWGLLWDGARREKEAIQGTATTIPPLALLVALCAFMLAYSFLQGYGVGLMLLAAWPVSLLLWPANEEAQQQSGISPRFNVAQTVSLLGAFLAVLLVSRVFATRFRVDLRGADLLNQFALFGFLAGAILPAWLASLWFGQNTNARPHSQPERAPSNESDTPSSSHALYPTEHLAKLDASAPPFQAGSTGASTSIASSLPQHAPGAPLRVGNGFTPLITPLPLIGIALLSLLLPGAMLAIWGVKVLPAFFAGLALSLCGWGGAVLTPARACTIALFAQALALTLTQWTQKFLPLADASRAQRTHFLLWGVGSAILLVLLIDVGTRLLLWLQKRQTGASGNRPTPETSP